MFMTLTKNQIKEQLKEIIIFCKENHCLMWNFMMTVKTIKSEEREKIKMEKKKK